MFEKCGPCNLHFNAIVKMETFDSDVRSILETAGLGWVAPSHQNDRGSHVTKQADIGQIFRNSSRTVIRRIMERYYMDFKICGYEETLQQLELLTRNTEEEEPKSRGE